MDIQVLGPLIVRLGGSPARLGPTLRVLFLALLCARGDLVPAGRLAEMISVDAASATTPATLRSHVSHLRRALAARGSAGPRVVTGRLADMPAYALLVDPAWIDASRFEQLIVRGNRELRDCHYESAAEVLREGISLWRGQPLADVAGRPFARAEIDRLEGWYQAAVVGRVQADVHRGLHRALTGELEAMAALWPDDEEVRCLLVTCLYRSGRPAEAARACRDGMEAALDQGLDPRMLAALQRDVLRGSLPETDLPHASTGFHGASTRLAEDRVRGGRRRQAASAGDTLGAGRSAIE